MDIFDIGRRVDQLDRDTGMAKIFSFHFTVRITQFVVKPIFIILFDLTNMRPAEKANGFFLGFFRHKNLFNLSVVSHK